MKTLCLVSIVFLCSVHTFAQARQTGTFTYFAKNGKHTAKLIITAKPFDRTKHTLIFAEDEYLKEHHYSVPKNASPTVIEIDRESVWYGIDSTTLDRLDSVREIVDMSVFFDGKKVDIFKTWFGDCYNPNFGMDYFLTKLNKTGDMLVVLMAASDAAGSYTVMWFL